MAVDADGTCVAVGMGSVTEAVGIGADVNVDADGETCAVSVSEPPEHETVNSIVHTVISSIIRLDLSLILDSEETPRLQPRVHYIRARKSAYTV